MKGIRPFQLHNSDGGRDIGEVVFVAWSNNFIVPGRIDLSVAVECIAVNTVKTHNSGSLCKCIVRRDYHAALSGGDGLIRVKTKDGCVGSSRSNHPTFI